VKASYAYGEALPALARSQRIAIRPAASEFPRRPLSIIQATLLYWPTPGNTKNQPNTSL
jgi:hypothetical protein